MYSIKAVSIILRNTTTTTHYSRIIELEICHQQIIRFRLFVDIISLQSFCFTVFYLPHT